MIYPAVRTGQRGACSALEGDGIWDWVSLGLVCGGEFSLFLFSGLFCISMYCARFIFFLSLAKRVWLQ